MVCWGWKTLSILPYSFLSSKLIIHNYVFVAHFLKTCIHGFVNYWTQTHFIIYSLLYQCGLKGNNPKLQMRFCFLVATLVLIYGIKLWPWKKLLILLHLSFPICKMKIVFSHNYYKDKWDDVWKVWHTLYNSEFCGYSSIAPISGVHISVVTLTLSLTEVAKPYDISTAKMFIYLEQTILLL